MRAGVFVLWCTTEISLPETVLGIGLVFDKYLPKNYYEYQQETSLIIYYRNL